MSNPPSGTVTFLFTDIEGSTRLAQAHPDAWEAAEERHQAILRGAIEAHGGHVFKIVGDAFCAAFQQADGALAAALACQRALGAEPWGETPVRVRMGIHTGPAEARDGDYHGYLTLARVQRIMSAGHGGQVLLSAASAELVRGRLPEAVRVKDMGRHRLKGIADPEQLWQLLVRDLPAEFPPLQTLNLARQNLPLQLTSFVGREREIGEVKALLTTERLVTLLGTGGTGKTRLAIQVAAGVVEDFEHGVCFVPLAGLSDAALLAQTVAQALEVEEKGGQPPFAAVREQLRDKQLLLVLDNFEQIVEAGSLVGEWLSAAPRLKVLVTSRTVLRIYGECEYAVHPLNAPDPARLPALAELAQNPTVALFVERARSLQGGFALTADNASAVAQICARVDGLPLAIELAAARCRLLSPAALLQRLERRLGVLTGGARDLPARHQTLRNAIGWSHDLLGESEKRLFRRLAVFSGGCMLDAAESLCRGEDGDVLDGLESLADKSLLRKMEQAGDEPRFGMLETIREFAAEQLAASGEGERLRAAHAAYFAQRCAQMRDWQASAEQALWSQRIEADHDNLRAALRWADETGADALGLQMAGLLSTFWLMRGYLSEGRGWLEKFLERSGGAGETEARIRALHGLGSLLRKRGDLAQAQAMIEQVLALRRAQSNTPGIASALNVLGAIAQERADFAHAMQMFEESLAVRNGLPRGRGIAVTLNNVGMTAQMLGDYARARTVLEECLGIFRSLGDDQGIAVVLNNLGETARDQGDYAQALVFHAESLELKRRLGSKEGVGYSLCNIGEIACLQGDLARAAQLVEEGLALFREIGHKTGIAIALRTLGDVANAQGAPADASRRYAESLRLGNELGDRREMAKCFEGLAAIACAHGAARRGARLLGVAANLRESLKSPLPPADRARETQCRAEARNALGGDAFDAAIADGNALTLEQAVLLALDAAPVQPRV